MLPLIYIAMESWIPTLINELQSVISIVNFIAQIVPDLAIRSPSKLAIVSFWDVSVNRWVLCFTQKDVSGSFLYFLWNQPFLQKTSIPFSVEWYLAKI